MSLRVEFYSDKMEKEWDEFVLELSMNGTFLQTRKFINYHPKSRFKDCSLCVRKGEELVAVCLACEINSDNGKIFYGHKGSTFGGITISENLYSATMVDKLIEAIEAFLKAEQFTGIYLKMVSPIYQKKASDLLDYFLYKSGYFCYNELNYFMELDRYKDDILGQFSASKRRDYRYSLKNGLEFVQLTQKKQIAEYYEVLQINLRKLGLNSVHTLEDLFDLYYNRFPGMIEFYGIIFEGKMIAGSMVFLINNDIFHTQYLSSDENYLKLYPMDYLITNLIQTAVKKKMCRFSFGICTEDQGRYLNLGLSRFKEGFGTEFCINRSYEKKFT